MVARIASEVSNEVSNEGVEKVLEVDDCTSTVCLTARLKVVK